MSDPNVYPQFPGFPPVSNANEVPPIVRDVRAGRLHPAISRADQDRGVGSENRARFGPPPGGWPVGPGGFGGSLGDLTPLKQRLIVGMREIAEQFGPGMGSSIQLMLGGIMGVMEEKVKQAPDEAIISGLTTFVQKLQYWLTGDGDASKSPASNPPNTTDSETK